MERICGLNPEIFKPYDIRGVYGEDFQPHHFYVIAQAFARVMRPRKVAVGYDVRTHSPELWEHVVEGLSDAGVEVFNIGPVSTDMMYFAVANYDLDGGLIVSASHNPAEWNGIKMVRREAVPISEDSGLKAIRDETLSMLRAGERDRAPKRGFVHALNVLEDYCLHVKSFANLQNLRPLKVVLNANHGFAGLVASKILEGTPVEPFPLFCEPDGTFSDIPLGRPDPLIPENRKRTSEAVREKGADFGVAWDADADRCFFFDENGAFIEGCYIGARLAQLLISRSGEENPKVIYDPRVVWVVRDAVEEAKGQPVLNKCGHSFIKERMRKEDALFGTEASAHYYFRRNFYADNGMVPFILVLEWVSRNGKLSQWVDELRKKYPVSGEINFEFPEKADMSKVRGEMERLLGELEELARKGEFDPQHRAQVEEKVDGLSIHFLKPDGKRAWRFNLRASKTEPRLRLNVEAFEDEQLLKDGTEKVVSFVEKHGWTRKTKLYWE